jgi:hypothetical protein
VSHEAHFSQYESNVSCPTLYHNYMMSHIILNDKSLLYAEYIGYTPFRIPRHTDILLYKIAFWRLKYRCAATVIYTYLYLWLFSSGKWNRNDLVLALSC